jgi:enediyne biosynthesis protein E4
MKPLHVLAIIVGLLFVSSCTTSGASTDRPTLAPIRPPESQPPTTIASQALTPSACSNHFITHSLPYQTETSSAVVHLFESNGAGVAIGDLNQDGLLDLVFANLAGQSTLLWNRGKLQFEPQFLEAQNTRAVAIVDEDGDGLLDIAFTQRGASVSLWRNLGTGQFRLTELPGVRSLAYTMAWADLNNDNRLDLVTGSYDAERSMANPSDLLDQTKSGIFVYLRSQQGYTATQLTSQAQALALAVLDIDRNGTRDIVVGNDFAEPDIIWLQYNGVLVRSEPFAKTSHSTMSFDWGDIDNSGNLAIFATDMKPFTLDVSTLAAWLPMMQQMPQQHPAGDRQIMANVLQVQSADHSWHEQAARRGIDATGWSWAGLFGDLDQDGLLDLYVVNGMIASELFSHLPNNELIEPNQAFRNRGGRFVAAPEWGLAATSSGRGMQLADLDNDGDLDSVVNTLGSPAELYESQLCSGSSLGIELRWPGSGNTQAIGATVQLHTNIGTMQRDVRVMSGYLSGSPTRIHFGIPADATVERLDIRWPDGQITSIEQPDVQQLLTITR